MNAAEFQKLVDHRPDLARFFHYVRPGKDGRRGYWQRIPITHANREARPRSLLRSQLAFSRASQEGYGSRGFRIVDGRRLPVIAARIKERTEGKIFKKPRWQQAIDELTEALKAIGRVVEEEVVV